MGIDAGFDPLATDWQYIAAGQTNVKLKGQNGKGSTGDLIVMIIPIPTTVSPGATSFKDGTEGSPITIWPGGAGGLIANLETRPEPVSFGRGIRCVSDAWYVTTGANVACLVVGRFL